VRPKIAIIADDLTGALDSAAPFAARGLHTVAAVIPEALDEVLSAGADAIAVNTLTRHLKPAAAAVGAERAARRCLEAGAELLFKKIDSRLRGHACVESVSVATALHAGCLVVAPAVPAQGRFVRNGELSGAGVEGIIDAGGPFAVATVAGLAVELPDASSDEDLDVVARSCIARSARNVLPVGTHGLASALARNLVPGASETPRLVGGPPILVVVGSQDPATAAQVTALSCHPDLAVVVEAPAGHLCIHTDMPTSSIVVLRSVPSPGDDGHPAERFADGAARWVTALRARTLVATGGDTVAGLLRRLGCRMLQVGGEAAPGIPWSLTMSGMTVISKSGGFGAQGTLVDLLRRLVENPQGQLRE
jgi:uncharacterized protein YgbK (DUF1537 family)